MPITEFHFTYHVCLQMNILFISFLYYSSFCFKAKEIEPYRATDTLEDINGFLYIMSIHGKWQGVASVFGF